jgi:hypothetical protein
MRSRLRNSFAIRALSPGLLLKTDAAAIDEQIDAAQNHDHFILKSQFGIPTAVPAHDGCQCNMDAPKL